MTDSEQSALNEAFDGVLGEISNAVRRIRKQRNQCLPPTVYELRHARDVLTAIADRGILL